MLRETGRNVCVVQLIEVGLARYFPNTFVVEIALEGYLH